MDFFSTHNIVKKYAHHLALDKVSINVPEGKIFGLLGPNGAGKTTLIRIINQITGPDSGEVIFKGEKLSGKHIEIIGYLPEERGLYKKMKVGEQALYLAQLKGLKRSDALKKLKFWFEKFEIQSWWDKKVEELSKGMQQKIQFMVTVIHDPKLLIFDEPFSGFDPINANLLKQEILELKKNGATIIFSTHNMASVEELCDNIALINNSKKILDGEVHQIRQQFKTNTFEVAFSNPNEDLLNGLNQRLNIIERKQVNGHTYIRLKLKDILKSNELLTTLLHIGEVVSFNEVIPGMNDIFIEVVEKNKASIG